MKVVTLGFSPYLNMSHARIHSMILKKLYFSKHQVACIATGHDTTYFIPEENEQGHPMYFYNFDEHKIPLIPMEDQNEPGIKVYEILKVFQPDMVVTIGDFNDHSFMKAVKMFADFPFKWVAILTNYSYPINENQIELIEDMDGILCTNSNSFDMLRDLFKKDEISLAHVGCGETLVGGNRDKDRFRIMSSGKNRISDNLPMLMETCSSLRAEIPKLELYLHSNIYDQGDYDLNLLKDRFDSKGEFITFPEKYVSLTDGYTENEYAQELAKSDIFANISLNSSSALTIFEGILHGCCPLMTDAGCHQDVADMLVKIYPEFQRDNFLVQSIEVMMAGEVYVNICKPDQLKNKILELHKKIKKGGYRTNFKQFTSSHNQRAFLIEVMNVIEAVKIVKSTLCVETV